MNNGLEHLRVASSNYYKTRSIKEVVRYKKSWNTFIYLTLTPREYRGNFSEDNIQEPHKTDTKTNKEGLEKQELLQKQLLGVIMDQVPEEVKEHIEPLATTKYIFGINFQQQRVIGRTTNLTTKRSLFLFNLNILKIFWIDVLDQEIVSKWIGMFQEKLCIESYNLRSFESFGVYFHDKMTLLKYIFQYKWMYVVNSKPRPWCATRKRKIL